MQGLQDYYKKTLGLRLPLRKALASKSLKPQFQERKPLSSTTIPRPQASEATPQNQRPSSSKEDFYFCALGADIAANSEMIEKILIAIKKGKDIFISPSVALEKNRSGALIYSFGVDLNIGDKNQKFQSFSQISESKTLKSALWQSLQKRL